MSDNKKKTPPKGGRKGGTLFPKINLKAAVGYAKRIVAKTHTGPQSENILLKGVFNNSGPGGKIKASALKQYSLLEGEAMAYRATDLAKSINSAPEDEVSPFLKNACLTPKIFKTLFDTFQGDEVTRAKIKQQALAQGVHPESGEECVSIFIASLEYAGLATIDQDMVTLSMANVSDASATEEEEDEITEETESTLTDENEKSKQSPINKRNLDPMPPFESNGSVKALVQVNITLDSSMDTEKLEKQLRLLKQFGAI
ncbi:hypothetical protein [Bdellovibrio sp. HCB288]|uniref:hypothetical protein n=1 Tax=Bdellovibrio sp. HCB288 TaxID=3394355 RepID=UPI0039B5F060